MTLGQNNHTEYDNQKPYADFEMEYTKKNVMSALKADRHIIYTLSPIVTVIALLLYIFAFYFYFSNMKEDIINHMIIGRLFTFVWCTIMTLMVVGVVAFFVTFEIIRFRKAKEILKQMPHQTEVKIYENRIEYITDDESIIAISYNDLYSIKETEEYYFVTCKNKQTIILDKSKSKGYSDCLTKIACSLRIYTQSLICANRYFCKIPAQKLAKIKNQSIRLIPLCIASIYIFILPSSLILPNISSAIGTVKIMLKIITCLMVLSSNIFPIYSIVFGAKYKMRNLKTTKNIVIGCITLFYSALFSFAICLALITL